MLSCLGSAWWSDIGGYFTGMLCGKHKLCPEISPKKTVEGLIGGLVFAILGNIGIMALITWLAARGLANLINPLTLHFGRICLLTPLLALLSVVGDLSFSIIKRTYGIKDYGNLSGPRQVCWIALTAYCSSPRRYISSLLTGPLLFNLRRHI